MRFLKNLLAFPGVFHSLTKNCIQGAPWKVAYSNNIYVTSPNDEEHLSNLRQVCKCSEKSGWRVNTKKCQIMNEKIEILGHVIDANGLHKSKCILCSKAIVEAVRPKDDK